MKMIPLLPLCLVMGLMAIPAASSLGAGEEADRFVYLSSTIGPIDAGIVGALEDSFEKETGIRVRHLGAGTGAALEVAKQGSVDLVLVHAKALEEKFVADGFGTERIPLMFNDFVIVGPADDPAGIRGMKSAAEAFRALAAKQAPFISRGDKSGTHVAEMEMWALAGVKPEGSWYTVWEKGSTGNGPTLKFTDEKKAYTYMDRATVITVGNQVTLQVLVENDPAMRNNISLIPVHPGKFPAVHHQAALKFVDWLTDPGKGQLLIRDFGKDKYGQPLFFPDSLAWRKSQGK